MQQQQCMLEGVVPSRSSLEQPTAVTAPAFQVKLVVVREPDWCVSCSVGHRLGQILHCL
jgi:hypothetical protein